MRLGTRAQKRVRREFFPRVRKAYLIGEAAAGFAIRRARDMRVPCTAPGGPASPRRSPIRSPGQSRGHSGGRVGGGLHELKRQLAAGDLAPLYFVVGEEAPLRDDAVAAIRAAVLGPDDANVGAFNSDVVYGDETEAAEILTLCGNLPMFATRRLVYRQVCRHGSADLGSAPLLAGSLPAKFAGASFRTCSPDGAAAG